MMAMTDFHSELSVKVVEMGYYCLFIDDCEFVATLEAALETRALALTS